MQVGTLTFELVAEHFDLVARPVQEALKESALTELVYVSEIDPTLADTATFCEKYDAPLDISTNCLVVEAKRADRTWYAAVLVLATHSADINGIVRRTLDARKISFAPMDTALKLTGMEYGGITPIGLPEDWPILVDEAVMQNDLAIIGGGIRGSKLVVKTKVFTELPNSTILDLAR